jgi:hypothetical protein
MRKLHRRTDMDVPGFFVIEMVDTGKVYTGTSTQMQTALLKIKRDLEKGNMGCPKLQRYYGPNEDIKVNFYPTADISEAKKEERKFRNSREKWLLLN